MSKNTKKIIGIVAGLAILAVAIILIWVYAPAIRGAIDNERYYTPEEVQQIRDDYEDDLDEMQTQTDYYKSQIDAYLKDLQDYKTRLETTTNNLNQALEQNEIDAEAIAGYLEDIAELNDDITDLNNQIKLYQELLEAYENSGKYEVVFYLVQNGEQTPYDVQVVEPNGYLSEVVEPEGNFEGWSLSIGGDLIESLTSVQITEDTNIYGTFYSTVTFMVNDEEYSTQQVGYNKYATDPEEPEVQYYTFEGWTLNGEDVVAVNSYPITEDTTFVGKLTTELITDIVECSWNGLTNFDGEDVWTDGEQVYYSAGPAQYVLNKGTSTWETKIWYGLDHNLTGRFVWTDGENIYNSSNEVQYILNKETSTWSSIDIGDVNYVYVSLHNWTDGEEVYVSFGENQYVFNKETSTWETKVWNGLQHFNAPAVWTDGKNIFYGNSHILDKTTSTWNTFAFDESQLEGSFDVGNVFNYKNHAYYIENFRDENFKLHLNAYVLNEEYKWEKLVWNNAIENEFLYELNINKIWSDGEKLYHSWGDEQYAFV